MKKVMFIMPNKGYSGAENVVIQIIKGISDKYDCYYVSENGIINEYLNKNNIKHIKTEKKLNRNELKKIIKSVKPDIIIATDYRASVILASISLKMNLVSHLHNNPTWIKKINLMSICYWLASFRFKKIFIVSDSIKNEYIFSKFVNKKMINISNPISCECILDEAKKYPNEIKYDFAFIGRFCEQKDPIKFIKIVKQVKDINNGIKVLMIGSGSWEDKVKDAVKEYDLNDVIELLGFQSEPYKYMKETKIICIPSKYEGFGLVAFEALTLGIPVIATPVGGLPGIVDNTCGCLVNEVDEFSKVIIKLLNDEKIYKSLKEGAIIKSKKIENYNQYIERIKKELDCLL